MKIPHVLAACAMAGMTIAGTTYVAADAAKGETIGSLRCVGCASRDDNRASPMPRGIFGWAAGAAPASD